MKRLILGLAALTLVAGDVGQAKAGLIDTTVDTKFYYPNISTVYSDFGTEVVNPTAFFSLYNNETTLITNTQIIYTGPDGSGTYASPAFNGYVYDFLDVGNLITSVTVDPSSTLAGFSQSSVTLTSDGAGGQLVELNLNQGLNFGPDNTVVLDISTVPEPSSLTLLGIAAIGSLVGSWLVSRRGSGLSDRDRRVEGIPGQVS
jgi:hypothetical protein